MRTTLLLLCSLFATFSPAKAQEVQLYRNGWGVPHIYGQTETDVMYGFGYAQAQDRLEAILKNYLTATGHMSRVFGPEHLDADFRQRLWQHEKMSRAKYSELDPHIRSLIETFLAGIAAYMKDHPHNVPEWAFQPEPHHILALGRYLAWQELEQQANREYHNLPPKPLPDNQWAISRERSAEDAVLLDIDPHQPWQTSTRWYEAHLHGGTLNAYGFTCPGLPVLITGHNDFLGWAMATGGSDGADVYELDLESSTATRYRYDKTWRPIQTDTVRIQVNLNGNIETHVRILQRTPHGPVLYRNEQKAWTFRLSIEQEVQQIEQLYRQITASNLKEFYAALALAQTGPQRVMYGDTEGNISYIRTGRIPLRPEIYTWDRPISGNTAATEWTGIHAQEDLLQIHNPRSGWLQDCGASPDRVTLYSPLEPGRYPDYIFNTIPGEESPRSFRAVQLLSALSRITLQEAFDLALDTYAVHSEHWLRALQISWASHGPQYLRTEPALESALTLLTRWNGRLDRTEKGASIYTRWRKFCQEKGRAINHLHILSSQQLGEETRRNLLVSLVEAVRDMKTNDGRIDVPWGEIHRIRTATKSWPFSGGPNVLRTVTTTPELALQYGTGGQSCTTVVLFRGPGNVESFSAVPFGQTDPPSSPHTWDQAEALFSRERLKPTGYRSAAGLILQHTLNSPSPTYPQE